MRQASLVGAQEAGDGLLVGMEAHLAGRATTDQARAAQWFAQDDFTAAPTLESAAAGLASPRFPESDSGVRSRAADAAGASKAALLGRPSDAHAITQLRLTLPRVSLIILNRLAAGNSQRCDCQSAAMPHRIYPHATPYQPP